MMNPELRTGPRAWIRALAPALAAAALLGSASVYGNDVFSGGGDGVGSLPMTSGNSGNNPAGGHTSIQPDQPPVLALIGKQSELRRVILSVEAAGGAWQVEALDDQGTVRVRFQKDAKVTLDRAALLSSSIAVRLENPASSGSLATIFVGDERRLAVTISAAGLDLRLQGVVQTGLADRGVEVVTQSAQAAISALGQPVQSQTGAHLSIRASGGTIVLTQDL